MTESPGSIWSYKETHYYMQTGFSYMGRLPNIRKFSQDGKKEYLLYQYHVSAKCLVTIQILEALIPFSLTAFRNLCHIEKSMCFLKFVLHLGGKKNLKVRHLKAQSV